MNNIVCSIVVASQFHSVGFIFLFQLIHVELVSWNPLAAHIGIRLCLDRGSGGDQLAPEDQGEEEGDHESHSDRDEEHIGAPQIVNLRDNNGSDHSRQGTRGHKNSQPEALWSEGSAI